MSESPRRTRRNTGIFFLALSVLMPTLGILGTSYWIKMTFSDLPAVRAYFASIVTCIPSTQCLCSSV